MVKNTIGGKKGKMLSKKHHATNNSSFPVAIDEEEIYVCVMKVFGGGVFEVVDKDAVKYKAYLRGKMKGSNKRHNLVSMNSILLVGIRSDLSDKFSVDILFVYDNHHIQILSLNSHFPISLLSISLSTGTGIGNNLLRSNTNMNKNLNKNMNLNLNDVVEFKEEEINEIFGNDKDSILYNNATEKSDITTLIGTTEDDFIANI